jgi:hypothetical protein
MGALRRLLSPGITFGAFWGRSLVGFGVGMVERYERFLCRGEQDGSGGEANVCSLSFVDRRVFFLYRSLAVLLVF